MSDNTATGDPWLDEPWSFTDDKRVPATLTVEPTASNAYGPEIFLSIERGGETASIWVDLETWEQIYRAGCAAHAARVEATQRGWT